MAITMEGDLSNDNDDWSPDEGEDMEDMDDCEDWSFPVLKVQAILKGLNSTHNPALQPAYLVAPVVECLESVVCCLMRMTR